MLLMCGVFFFKKPQVVSGFQSLYSKIRFKISLVLLFFMSEKNHAFSVTDYFYRSVVTILYKVLCSRYSLSICTAVGKGVSPF